MITPYFESEDFTLYLDDCLNIIKSIPTESVSVVFADPPYFLSNDGYTVQNGKRVNVNKGDWDKSLNVQNDFKFQLDWIREIKRVLKPDGTIWISGTYHSIFQCGYALQLTDYHILNDLIWFKPNASPNLACTVFTASHETLIWARKTKKNKHFFNYDLMKNGEWHEVDKLKNEGKQMRSVWALTGTKSYEKIHGKHPTQKPEELLKRIILASTREGDLILDPFNGSGTTGIIASRYGRKYIGVDLDKSYLDLTIKRQEENYKEGVEKIKTKNDLVELF